MTLKEIRHQLLTNLKYFILPNPRNKNYIKEQIAFQQGQESLLKTLWSSPGKVGQTLIWENISENRSNCSLPMFSSVLKNLKVLIHILISKEILKLLITNRLLTDKVEILYWSCLYALSYKSLRNNKIWHRWLGGSRCRITWVHWGSFLLSSGRSKTEAVKALTSSILKEQDES